MSPIKIIILGCGPAGLLAAHAARQQKYQPLIISKKQPSKIGGAQYLHRPILGVTGLEPDGVIDFRKCGTATGYAKKVYGRSRQTSWDQFQAGPHQCWNLRAAYNRLWGEFEPNIVDMEITPVRLARLLESEIFAGVISTLPLKALCVQQNHWFKEKEVWISEDANVLTASADRLRWDERLPDNAIIWNGSPEVRWYRQSCIFGFPGTEWPMNPMDRKVVKVTKPLSTNCNCWPTMIKVGRYGQWKKGVLTHHAYEDTIKSLVGSLA